MITLFGAEPKLRNFEITLFDASMDTASRELRRLCGQFFQFWCAPEILNNCNWNFKNAFPPRHQKFVKRASKIFMIFQEIVFKNMGHISRKKPSQLKCVTANKRKIIVEKCTENLFQSFSSWKFAKRVKLWILPFSFRNQIFSIPRVYVMMNY